MDLEINELYSNTTYSDDILNNVGGYNNNRLGFTSVTPERMSINEYDENKPYDVNLATRVANEIATKEGYQTPKFLGQGSFGVAFDIGDNVLKITSDRGEAINTSKLLGRKLKRLAEPKKILEVKSSTENIPETYAIVLEKLETDSDEFWNKFVKLYHLVATRLGYDLDDFVDYYFFDKNIEGIDNDRVIDVMKTFIGDGEFFFDLMDIKNELKKYGLQTDDFVNHTNLGYKDDLKKMMFQSQPNKINVTENDVINEDYDRNVADRIANEIAELKGFQSPKFLGEGSFGVAYDIGNNKVLKITSDKTEATENLNLLNKDLDRIAEPYNIFHVSSQTQSIPETYAIVLEKLKTNINYFSKKHKRFKYIITDIIGIDYNDWYDYVLNDEGVRGVGDKLVELNNYLKNNPDDLKYYTALIEINNELNKYDITSKDFMNPHNLGYKNDGKIAFFDVGFGNWFSTSENQPEKLEISEFGGGALHSTQDTISSIHEREKSGMSGSVAVKVKDKCKLAGLGNTSKACNQGDINNLTFEPIKEEMLGTSGANELKDKNVEDIKPLINDLKLLYDKVKNREYLSGDDVDDLFHIFKIYHYNRDIFESTVYKYLINFMIKTLKHRGLLKEQVDADDSNSDKKTLDALISGEKDVGTIVLKRVNPDIIKQHGLKTFKVDNDDNLYIVFKPNAINKAIKLHRIMMRHGGYLNDITPEEAYEIGKILNYTDDSINRYLVNKYKKYRNKNTGEFVSSDNIGEGVGDEYLRRKHGIETDEDEFEKQYGKHQSYESNKVVYDKNGITLIKNPQSLVNVGSDVRGIIKNNGDLYIEQESQVTHDRIINILNGLGLVNMNDVQWSKAALELPTKLVGVQRRGYNNEIYLSESHLSMIKGDDVREQLKNSIFYEKGDLKYDYNEAAPYYNKFLNKAKQKNPDINFINESIYPYLDYYDSEEHDEDIKMDETMRINENDILSLDELPFKEEIQKMGGKIYSVGGAVRDSFLEKESKDLDILITGIPIKELESILDGYGRVDAVGKSFGILKFKPEGSEEDIDVAIPRTEVPTGGGGHKDFDVKSDHSLPIDKDLERRDFTINAIAKDINGNIIDPYGGMDDLKNKIIRVVNPDAFSDDPLRMLRAVQFASRFGFKIEPKTMNLIKKNTKKINEIPAERILTEFEKIVNKGNPFIGAFQLKNTGLLKHIFGNDNNLNLDESVWNGVKTMGEFIWLLSHNLVDEPAEFFKKNLSGDINTYKEIKALNMVNNENIKGPVHARSIAHNIFVTSPQTLKSNILPDEVKKASDELLNGKYPKSIGELDINGNDLMQLGLKGKEIGDTVKSLLLKVYADKVNNRKEDLLNHVNVKNNER